MQKESLLFFSFPSEKDSRLVSLGLSKKFSEARATNKQLTQNYVFLKPNITNITLHITR